MANTIKIFSQNKKVKKRLVYQQHIRKTYHNYSITYFTHLINFLNSYKTSYKMYNFLKNTSLLLYFLLFVGACQSEKNQLTSTASTQHDTITHKKNNAFDKYFGVSPWGDTLQFFYKQTTPTKLKYYFSEGDTLEETLEDTIHSSLALIQLQGTNTNKRANYIYSKKLNTIADSLLINSQKDNIISLQWIKEAQQYHQAILANNLLESIAKYYPSLKTEEGHNLFTITSINLDTDQEDEIVLFFRYKAFYNSYVLILDKTKENYLLKSVIPVHTWGYVARPPIIQNQLVIVQHEIHGTALGGYVYEFYKYQNKQAKQCLYAINEHFQSIIHLGIDEYISSTFNLKKDHVIFNYNYHLKNIKTWKHIIKYKWNEVSKSFELVKTKETSQIVGSQGYLYFFEAHEQEIKRIAQQGTTKLLYPIIFSYLKDKSPLLELHHQK